ncbi:MAG: 2-amino-4-hydroxy-6-hydroxymethyldihydropteridine diphosphokinase [Candidatus Omnitrophota bacterium]|nr:2-amino-4-hydroxy-6-hydroxymethyldihydropteridine diphosphokinase [Candidatus Omnitrophota bacterium]
MAHVFLGVGSNLGDRRENLDAARRELELTPQIKDLRSSPVYETEPVGGPPQGKFLNAVWEFETSLEPPVLFELTQSIESQLGRSRQEKNCPRTIDLDVLFYEKECLQGPLLTVPHPRLHERRFVLEPLHDLAPDWVHPIIGKTVQAMLEELPS